MTFNYLMDYVRARPYDTGHFYEAQAKAFYSIHFFIAVKRTINELELNGPILALDLGEKLVGVAISDERLITTKRLPPLKRSNWKKLLQEIRNLIERFDAQTIVVGLPLRLDGTEGDAAGNVRRLALNLAKSVEQPVYLQDERLTSFAATENLKKEGLKPGDIAALVDGEAAATILRDFIVSDQKRLPVEPSTGDQDKTEA